MDLNLIIERAGGVMVVAKAFNLHHSSVIGWKNNAVPAKHARRLARMACLHPHDVRPDLYDPPSIAKENAA